MPSRQERAAHGSKDATPEAQSPESLDALRDILVGAQQREMQARVGSLEERVARETSELRKDFGAMVEPLEIMTRTELRSLRESQQKQELDRLASLTRMSDELRSAERALEKQLASTEERLGRRLGELRALLDERLEQFAEQCSRRSESVLAAVASATRELDTRKPDRARLASLFAELATHLGREASRAAPLHGGDSDAGHEPEEHARSTH